MEPRGVQPWRRQGFHHVELACEERHQPGCRHEQAHADEEKEAEPTAVLVAIGAGGAGGHRGGGGRRRSPLLLLPLSGHDTTTPLAWFRSIDTDRSINMVPLPVSVDVWGVCVVGVGVDSVCVLVLVVALVDASNCHNTHTHTRKKQRC
jgi:hypothetical protein